MPVVPRYQRQVQEQGMPNVRLNADAPIEAFGGGQSAAQATQATNQALKNVGDAALQFQHQANLTAVAAAENELKALKNNIELDTRKVLGKDALGAPDVAGKRWNEGSAKIAESLANDAQRAAFKARVSDHWVDLDKSVKVHAYTQYKGFQDETAKSNIELSQSAAAMNAGDDVRVGKELMRQKEVYDAHAQANGIPVDENDPVYKAGLQAVRSKTHFGVIEARIEQGMDAKAMEYFEAHKGEMSDEHLLAAQKKIEAVKETKDGLEIYDQIRGFKLPDGRTPDTGKMEDWVMARQDLSNEKKIRIAQFVKAKASSDHQEMLQRDKAVDESFRNAAVKLKKSGGTLEQALKLSPSYAYDDYDQSLKDDFVRKLWAGKEIKSDPATLVALSDAIDEGRATKAEIDRAFRSEKVSASDWVQLRSSWHNSEIEGKNPEQKRANEQIRLLARERFGSDKEGMDAFISEVYSAAQGKSADEKVKIAHDKLKDDESSSIRFWNWVPFVGGSPIPGMGQPQYQTDVEKRTNNSLVVGKFNSDLGVDAVKALGYGAGKAPAEAVNDLSVAFGGYKNVLPGTPVHNAILSLQKYDKPVTIENIRAALKAKPDGKF